MASDRQRREKDVTKQLRNAAKRKDEEENWSFENRTDAKKLKLLIKILPCNWIVDSDFLKSFYYRKAI